LDALAMRASFCAGGKPFTAFFMTATIYVVVDLDH